MAIYPLFTHSLPVKHTDDTSIDRSNDYPSIIRDSNGRYIMFYQKKLKTGKTSQGGVTFTSPSLDCSIPAGTGEVNFIAVSWGSTVLTLPSNSYVLIYVTAAGVVGYSVDFPISFTKNVIILAFAYVGAGSIVRIINMERDGYYIYHRKQVLSGSNYIWDDYEYKLNVGEKPQAFYDPSLDKILLSFQKDGASMVREFDLSNPSTWADINHILFVDPTLTPIPQPRVDLLFKPSFGNSLIQDSSPPLFDFLENITVGLETGSNDPFLHIPQITSTFLNYATFPCNMNVFTKSGLLYILQDQFLAYKDNRNQGILQFWGHSRGDKYAGLEVEHTLFSGDYITDPSNYWLIHIPDALDETEDVDATHKETKIYPEVWNFSVSFSGGSIEKITEYDQDFTFNEDSIPDFEVAFSEGYLEKITEYDQVFDFPDDSFPDFEVAFSGSIHSIVNV